MKFATIALRSFFIIVMMLMFTGLSLLSGQTKHIQKAASKQNKPKTVNPVKFENEEEGEVWRREQYYYLRRAGGQGKTIPEDWYANAIAQKRSIKSQLPTVNSIATAPVWESVNHTGLNYGGSIYASGRVTSAAFDPIDASTIYVCTASGGVWKTSDGGSTWNCITDGISTNTGGAVSVDPNNHLIVYYASGELNYSYAELYGDGVFKSTDGGSTWTKIATSALGKYFSHVVVSPANSNTVYISGSVNTYKTTNGGVIWKNLSTGGDVHSLIINPLNPNTIYVSLGDPLSANTIKKSTNAGTTWTTIMTGFSSIGRTELFMAPGDTNVLYASSDISGATGGLFQTSNGGASWNRQDGTHQYMANGQQWYDNAVCVDPSDPNHVIVGGTDIYSSSTSGTNLLRMTFYTTPPHPDVHFLQYNGSTLYTGTDGGFFKTTDNGASWSSLNLNISTIQYVGIDYKADDPTFIMGGSQDNGRSRTSDRGASVQLVQGGDGGYLSIDPITTNVAYGEFYNKSLQRTQNSGSNWSNIYPSAGGAGLFYNPFELAPGDHNTLLLGLSELWKTSSATTVNSSGWTQIAGSSILGSGNNVASIGISSTNTNKIYFGSDAGSIYVTTNNGTNWSSKSGFNYVSDLAVDGGNDNICYAVFGGFGEHVAKTTDGGATWLNISGNLPNAPVNAVALRRAAPRMVIVGTEIGVFSSTDEGTTWTALDNGLSIIPINELKFKENTQLLLAGTYGRGGYYLDLSHYVVTFNKNSITYGDVYFNSPKPDSVIISNSGSNVLSISSVVSSDSSFVVSPSSGTVPASGSMVFYVTCGPVTSGNLSATITFNNDGSTSPNIITVSARGFAPHFSVQNNSINLGRSRIGIARQDSIMITNTGNATLGVTGVTADNSVFQVNNTPDAVLAGSTKAFYYSFQPVGLNDTVGHLVFANDSHSGHDTITVTGSGSVALITINVLRDFDGSLSTSNDQSPKLWHLTLYEDSVSAGSFVAETTASSWNYNLLAPGTFIVAESDSGSNWSRINGNFTTYDTLVVPANSTVSDTFINQYFGVAIPIISHWNLLSTPIVQPAYTTSVLYPQSITTAYSYDSTAGYKTVSAMPVGRGYWLKFPGAGGDTLYGKATTHDTVHITAGWNIIGSVSYPVSGGQIVQSPPLNFKSKFFGWKNGYTISDTIQPGMGYWVKAAQSGTTELNSALPPGNTPKIAAPSLARFNSITFIDNNGSRQTLYFGTADNDEPDLSLYDMPPPGPAGNFDVRFASNRMAEIQTPESGAAELPISISSPAFPVTVSWNLTEGGDQYVLSGSQNSKSVPVTALSKQGSLVIKDARIKNVVLKNTSFGRPKEYGLQQNYPNPFNPSTSIRYQLPVDSKVTITIFNVAGQEIKTLVNGVQNAGYKSAQWNGLDNRFTAVPSGVYFCRIEAIDIADPAHSFTQTQKMMMVK